MVDELTLITEEKEYEPETTKPGMPQTEEAWKRVEEERIAWEKAEKVAEDNPDNPKGLIKLAMVRLRETGEYKVKWIENDVFNEAKSYYTDDFDDAVGTSIAMAAEAKKAGFNVIRSDPELLRPESSNLETIAGNNPGEPTPEIPDVVEIGEVKLTPGETFYYTAWGIRYRFGALGEWRVAQMAFRSKSDAEDWMKRYYTPEALEAEVTPVKQCLLLESRGNIKAWVEELG